MFMVAFIRVNYWVIDVPDYGIEASKNL